MLMGIQIISKNKNITKQGSPMIWINVTCQIFDAIYLP